MDNVTRDKIDQIWLVPSLLNNKLVTFPAMNVKTLLCVTWGVDLTHILANLAQISDGAKVILAILNGVLVFLTALYILKARKSKSEMAAIEVTEAEYERIGKMIDTFKNLNLLKGDDWTQEDLETAITAYKKLLKLSR